MVPTTVTVTGRGEVNTPVVRESTRRVVGFGSNEVGDTDGVRLTRKTSGLLTENFPTTMVVTQDTYGGFPDSSTGGSLLMVVSTTGAHGGSPISWSGGPRGQGSSQSGIGGVYWCRIR